MAKTVTGVPRPGLSDTALESLQEMLVLAVLIRHVMKKPERLEEMIVSMLVSMGYGNRKAVKGCITARTDAGVVDMKIFEHPHDYEPLCVRIQPCGDGGKIEESDLRDFESVLEAADTFKGMFIANGLFSEAADRAAEEITFDVDWIDGRILVRLLRRHNISLPGTLLPDAEQIVKDYFDWKGFV